MWMIKHYSNFSSATNIEILNSSQSQSCPQYGLSLFVSYKVKVCYKVHNMVCPCLSVVKSKYVIKSTTWFVLVCQL